MRRPRAPVHVVPKLAALGEVQTYLEILRKAEFTLTYARKDTNFVGKHWKNKTPWAVTIAYLVVFPKGSEPTLLCAPRREFLATDSWTRRRIRDDVEVRSHAIRTRIPPAQLRPRFASFAWRAGRPT